MGSNGWLPTAKWKAGQPDEIRGALAAHVPAERLGGAVARAEHIIRQVLALEADGLNAAPRGDGLAEDEADLLRLIERARDEGDRENLERELRELREDAARAARRTGPRPDLAARALIELAAGLWSRETGRPPALGRGASRSHFEVFALTLLGVAHLDAQGIKTVRNVLRPSPR